MAGLGVVVAAADSLPAAVPVGRPAAVPARPGAAGADPVARAAVLEATAVVPEVGAVREVLRSAGARSGVATAPSSNRRHSA